LPLCFLKPLFRNCGNEDGERAPLAPINEDGEEQAERVDGSDEDDLDRDGAGVKLLNVEGSAETGPNGVQSQ